MPDKWDKSSKEDFTKAAAAPTSKESLDDKAKTGEVDPAKGQKVKQDQPTAGLRPPGMGSPTNHTAWDRHRDQQVGRGSVSKEGPAISKEDPKLSKNFNNRSKS